MTHPITVLSEKQQAELRSLKDLPEEQQAIIVNAINKLFGKKPLGETPASELLTETGHPDLAATCWAAKLLNIDWR